MNVCAPQLNQVSQLLFAKGQLKSAGRQESNWIQIHALRLAKSGGVKFLRKIIEGLRATKATNPQLLQNE